MSENSELVGLENPSESERSVDESSVFTEEFPPSMFGLFGLFVASKGTAKYFSKLIVGGEARETTR